MKPTMQDRYRAYRDSGGTHETFVSIHELDPEASEALRASYQASSASASSDLKPLTPLVVPITWKRRRMTPDRARLYARLIGY
ncbi:MAG TPA: hypothetical protein VG941_00290 [Candidatus Paceibacterota bacterium]|nr:hypothetical protein [Candidatus Paceibacterota bacterium]